MKGNSILIDRCAPDLTYRTVWISARLRRLRSLGQVADGFGTTGRRRGIERGEDGQRLGCFPTGHQGLPPLSDSGDEVRDLQRVERRQTVIDRGQIEVGGQSAAERIGDGLCARDRPEVDPGLTAFGVFGEPGGGPTMAGDLYAGAQTWGEGGRRGHCGEATAGEADGSDRGVLYLDWLDDRAVCRRYLDGRTHEPLQQVDVVHCLRHQDPAAVGRPR